MSDTVEAEVVNEDDEYTSLLNEEAEPVNIRKGTQNIQTKLGILTEKQMIFASEIAIGTPVGDAYRKAFPGEKAAQQVSKYANKLINNPKVRQQIEILQQAARMRFLMDAPRAAEKLIELSKEAKSEKVQLEATKDILNRGGLQPPQRVETIHVGIFGSASQDDIRALLRRQIESKKEDDESNG